MKLKHWLYTVFSSPDDIVRVTNLEFSTGKYNGIPNVFLFLQFKKHKKPDTFPSLRGWSHSAYSEPSKGIHYNRCIEDMLTALTPYIYI